MKKKVNKGKNKEKRFMFMLVLLIGQTVNNIQWEIWGSPLGPHHRGQENIFRPGLNSTVVICCGLLLGAAPCIASPQAFSVNAFLVT